MALGIGSELPISGILPVFILRRWERSIELLLQHPALRLLSLRRRVRWDRQRQCGCGMVGVRWDDRVESASGVLAERLES